MNKAYRTLWSEARQCFVVAHEKAAARGKPSTTRKALVRAVAAALLVLGAAPALATNLCTGGATTISGTTTPPDNCSLGNNASLTVTGTGKLLAGTNTTGVEVYGVTTTGSIINHGTIAAARTGIRVESNSSIGGGITNTGQITSSDKRGIRVESSILAGSIYNSGTITGGTAGILLESETTLGGGITNSGTIQGGSAGIMIFSSTLMGKIVNHGSILTDSTGDAAALFIRSSSVVGGLVNDGTIDGRPKGILLAFSSTLTGGLTNSGTIQGGSAGVNLIYYSTLTGGLTNSGTIAGSEYAIYVDSSSLDSIVITGNDTAKFIGEVYAPATPVTVAGGATYTLDNGNHFQVQIFTNQGTLKIGAGSEATISGDFTLANTGTFSPAVADSGYGRISVSGAVALGGTLAVDAAGLTAANTYNGTVAGVIYGGSSRTGTFATVTDNSLLFDFTPVYKTDGFDLTFGGSSPGGVLAAVNATGNSPARGAAAALDAIIADNPGGPIATLFLPFSTQQQVSDAVSQTLPLLTGSAGVARGSALHGTNRIVQSVQEGQHGRNAGDVTFVDGHFWFKPFGSWANQDDRKGVSGYDARTYGLVAGADGELDEANRLGFALAYSRSKVDGNSTVAPNSADIDSYQAVVYGSHSLGPATDFSYQADIGYHNTEGDRSLYLLIPGAVARSDYDSWSAHLGAGVSHTLSLGERTSFTPSVRADYTWMRDDSYTETGAGVLNLHVKRNTTEELILAVDGKLVHALTDKATFTANAGVGYDVIDERASLTAAFAGAPGVAFTTRGLDPSPWMGRLGLGLVGKVSDTVEVTARYDAELRQDFDNQTASIKVRWAF